MNPDYLYLEPVKGFNTAQATQSPNLCLPALYALVLAVPTRIGDGDDAGTSTQPLRVPPAIRPGFAAV